MSAAPQFSVKDLGTPFVSGGPFFQGLNSSGQSAVQDSSLIPYISGPNETQPFTPVVGNLGGGWANITAINDSGQVTGISGTTKNLYMHAFLYSNGTMTDIGALTEASSKDGGLTFTYAPVWSRSLAINNLGHISGRSQTSVIYNPQTHTNISAMHAFLWDGAMHDIGTLGGSYSSGEAINNSDVVVGISGTTVDNQGANQDVHAFYYDGTIHDIAPFGSWTLDDGSTLSQSNAMDINNLGHIVGNSTVSSETGSSNMDAFVYDVNDKSIVDIGRPTWSSWIRPASINDLDQIVGNSGSPNTFGYEGGFFYSKDTGFVDLKTLIPENSGFTYISPIAINNNGQILVDTADSNGVGHQLLLTPKQVPTITWSNPADIVYGTPISSTQLNATADVPGTFTYNIAEGTVLHAGAAQSLVATFTPTDTSLYTTATAEAFLNVLPAPLTVTANNVTKVQGQVNPTFTGTITGLVNGDTDVATYSTTATTSSSAGTYDIIPFLIDSNYAITFVSGTLTVTPKPAGYRPPPSPW